MSVRDFHPAEAVTGNWTTTPTGLLVPSAQAVLSDLKQQEAARAAGDLEAGRELQLDSEDRGRIRQAIDAAKRRITAMYEKAVPAPVRTSVRVSVRVVSWSAILFLAAQAATSGAREQADLLLTEQTAERVDTWDQFGGIRYWVESLGSGLVLGGKQIAHELSAPFDGARLNARIGAVQLEIDEVNRAIEALTKAQQNATPGVRHRSEFRLRMSEYQERLATLQAERDALVEELDRETGPFRSGGSDLQKHRKTHTPT